jgi:putative aminopeptidase FrvX
MRKDSLEFLKKLLTTSSPSGFETENQKNWVSYAKKFADKVETDNYGNAVAILNPKGSPKIMLDSHIDEIGLMIKHIDDQGFLSIQSIGGVDPALIRGKRLNIHTEKGPIRGIVAAPPIHLRDRSADPKPPKMHEIFVDLGVNTKKEAEKLVSVGDPATFVDDFELLQGDIAVARAMDNRAGAWSVIEALRIASTKKSQLKCAIYACSSIQEETGLCGAQMQVFNVKPDLAIAVDVTHATDIPGINIKEHGLVKLGEGPVVTIGRESHPLIVQRLKKLSTSKKLPMQVETFSLTGGTDAWAIWTKEGGIPSTILSIPNRYMHTTVEMIHLKDLENTANLLAQFCLSIKKNESFKVKI